MELSTSILNGLKCLANVPNDFYSILIKSVFETFFLNAKTGSLDLNLDTSSVENLNKLSKAELKESIAALYTLISELAKHDVDTNSVSTFLEDIGHSSEKITMFRDNYEAKISIIRIYLSSSMSSYPHIVDVKWRLDYRIKENNLERINQPTYLIELAIEKPDQETLSNIQFSCTIEQLQDLIYKLREAIKAVEKLAQIQ